MQIHHTLCRMCDDRCGINVTVDEGKIVAVSGQKDHPWNQGRLCIKGQYAHQAVQSSQRIYTPMKRIGNDWHKISLQTALDEVAEKIQTLQTQYGPAAVGVWKGEALGFAQQENLARRFTHAIGTPNYFSNDTACFCSRYMGFASTYGCELFPDFEFSRTMMVWGANPPFSHPFVFDRMMKAKRRGAKLIVVDPVQNEIARMADIHAMPWPGTDGALAWGLIHQLFEKGIANLPFLQEYSTGWEAVRAYARRFTPDETCRLTGVEPEQQAEIIEALATEPLRTGIYVGNGLEHHRHGMENIRAIGFLPGIVGAVDTQGGNRIYESPNLPNLTLYNEKPLLHLSPIGAQEFPLLYRYVKQCHNIRGLEAMVTGKPYPLRALIMTAANPVLTNPDSQRTSAALSSLDLLVVRDLFMTATAQLAHYFLPAASFFERSELVTHGICNLLGMTSKILSYKDCQDEYQFWHDLAHRLHVGEYFPWETEEELNAWLLSETQWSPEQLRHYPEGITFKPVSFEKWRHKPFATTTGKIRFLSTEHEALGFPGLPEYPQEAPNIPENGLLLISGARQRLFNHSRNHQIPEFQRMDPEPFLTMRRADARQLLIAHGEWVQVVGPAGEMKIRASLCADERMRPGVATIPHAWDTANVNQIIPNSILDPLSGFPVLKAVPIQVKRQEQH